MKLNRRKALKVFGCGLWNEADLIALTNRLPEKSGHKKIWIVEWGKPENRVAANFIDDPIAKVMWGD